MNLGTPNSLHSRRNGHWTYRTQILPNDRYSIEIMPNAIIDFFENTNDTLNYNFTTKKRSDYGNLYLNLSGINFDKLILFDFA